VDTIKLRKADWFGYSLHRKYLLKHVIWGKIKRRKEVKGRRGGRRKQPLDNHKKSRGYLELKEESLGRTLWRTDFRRGCGLATECMHVWQYCVCERERESECCRLKTLV
jgi:hypothetical protein